MGNLCGWMKSLDSHIDSGEDESFNDTSSQHSINDDYGSVSSQKELKDIADIRNYFKHKSGIPWRRFKKQLWDQKWLIILFILLEIGLILMCTLNPDWKVMSWEAIFSLELTLVLLITLIADYYPPALIFTAGLAIVYGLGIVDDDLAFQGFSNTGVITVGILFPVAKGLEMSNVLRYVVKYILRNPKSILSAQIRLLVPVAFFSAFINNTPLVALMIPVVQNWSGSCGLNVSKLLMPLSYAAIMGGTCTIIGTSTNIIVQGLAQQVDPTMNLGFFEIGIVGVPVLIIGLIYMILFSPCLLPNAKPDDISTSGANIVPISNPEGNPNQRRTYTSTLTVTSSSNMVGKTAEESGLMKLKGLTLFHISRQDEEFGEKTEEIIHEDAVDSETIIHAGDTLFFSGMLKDMYVLYQLDGLVPATTQVAKIQGARADRVIIEVVLASHAPFIGKTVRQSHFRTRYNAVIIAINRYGVRLAKRIGDITLKAGDVLLLEATTDFLKYHRGDSHFALVSEILRGESTTPRRVSIRMLVATSLALVMIILPAFELYGLLEGAFIVAVLYVLCKILTWRQAMESIQGDTLLIIAAAFALANALQVSGAANVVSNTLVEIFSIGGPIGILFGLYGTTALLSAVISNGATVTLMFPIAIGFAQQSGLSLKCITYTLMLAASCSFATPVGYQTNIMVMGPGGYTTKDYIKYGLPLTFICMISSVILCYFVWADDIQPSREDWYDVPVPLNVP